MTLSAPSPENRAAAYAYASIRRQAAGAAFRAGLDAEVVRLHVENDAAGYRARTLALGDQHAREIVRIDEELKAALGFADKQKQKAPRVRKTWVKAPPTTRQERFAKRQLSRESP